MSETIPQRGGSGRNYMCRDIEIRLIDFMRSNRDRLLADRPYFDAVAAEAEEWIEDQTKAPCRITAGNVRGMAEALGMIWKVKFTRKPKVSPCDSPCDETQARINALTNRVEEFQKALADHIGAAVVTAKSHRWVVDALSRRLAALEKDLGVVEPAAAVNGQLINGRAALT